MNKNIIFLIVFSIFLLIPFISKAAVVINEVAWMGTDVSHADEWVELYSDQQIDLSGWVLEATDGTPIINLEGSIPANGYFLLERTNDQTVPDVTADQTYAGALGNDGENLKLKDNNGSIIDEVNCSEGWFAGNNSTKQTMERTIDDWQTSLNSGGTPKSQNSSGEESEQEPEEEPGEPEESEESQEEFEEDTQSVSAPTDVGATTGTTSNQPPIADARNDIIAFIDEEVTFDGSDSRDPDGNDLTYEWNLGEGEVKEDVIITHKYSYPGTYLVTLTVFDGRYYSKDTITVEIYPKKITINEFLPSPIGKDAEEEWVELYNDSDQIVNISGWQLDDEDGGSKPFTFPENTLIAPKGFLVFSRKTTGIALNNDSDKVRLLLSTGLVFQEVSYEKAPEGQSSAKTPQGFVWSTPTPGLPNIVITEQQAPEYEGSLQSETTSQPTGNTVLNYKNDSKIEGGWQELSKTKSPKETQQNYYNLANLEKSTGSNNKLILIILTIAIVSLAVGIGILKLKKKI